MTNTFHVVDYVVFGVSLLIPLGIGVFFNVYHSKKQTTSDYLLGGRQMGCFVLGFSLVVSFFNAIFLVSAPAETYYFGMIWTMLTPPYIATCVINTFLMVPFFRRFPYSSAYEYLEKRYKSRIPRIISSFGFVLNTTSFLAVVMYAPALVFNQVSGLNMNYAIAVCGLVCAVYTFLGGMRAVLWSDFVQTIIILVAFTVMSLVGIQQVGGWSAFTEKLDGSQRLNFINFDTDLQTRHTTLTQLIGGFFINLCLSNQMAIQRVISAKSTKVAQLSYLLNMTTSCCLVAFTSFFGLIVYVYFIDCDPIVSGATNKKDQLVPHFVMAVFGAYPGLPGCFIAAIFAAALSTVSSIVNSLSLVTVEDFVKPLVLSMQDKDLTDRATLKLTKAFTALFGVASICLAFAAPYMGPIMLQIPPILNACFGAPINVLFAVSILWPYTNVWGATLGVFGGLSTGLCLALSKMMFGEDPVTLPVGQCSAPTIEEAFNVTLSIDQTYSIATSMSSVPSDDVIASKTLLDGSFFIYVGNLSYMWYPVITWIVTSSLCVLLSAVARLLRLPLTNTDYVYKSGLVHFGYKKSWQKPDVYADDCDKEAVLLTRVEQNGRSDHIRKQTG